MPSRIANPRATGGNAETMDVEAFAAIARAARFARISISALRKLANANATGDSAEAMDVGAYAAIVRAA